MGSLGQIRADMERNEIEVTSFVTREKEIIRLEAPPEWHGGGDEGIMQDFVRLVRQNGQEAGLTSASISVESHLMALAAETSRLETRSVRYNYHMHSCYSDATNTPEELVEFAIEHGIKSTALTDHDTVDGVDAFMSVAAGADLEAIPGVEISSRIGQKFVHILGYGIDIKNVELLDLLDTLTEEATDYTKNVFVKNVAEK